jgi:hypothetical protein
MTAKIRREIDQLKRTMDRIVRAPNMTTSQTTRGTIRRPVVTKAEIKRSDDGDKPVWL